MYYASTPTKGFVLQLAEWKTMKIHENSFKPRSALIKYSAKFYCLC